MNLIEEIRLFAFKDLPKVDFAKKIELATPSNYYSKFMYGNPNAKVTAEFVKRLRDKTTPNTPLRDYLETAAVRLEKGEFVPPIREYMQPQLLSLIKVSFNKRAYFMSHFNEIGQTEFHYDKVLVRNGIVNNTSESLVFEVAGSALVEMPNGSEAVAEKIPERDWVFLEDKFLVVMHLDGIDIMMVKKNEMATKKILTLWPTAAGYEPSVIKKNNIVIVWQVKAAFVTF